MIPVTPIQEPVADEHPNPDQQPTDQELGKSPEESHHEDILQHEKQLTTSDGSIGHPEEPATWHDVALSIGSELMTKARQEVLQRLGYSTSAVGL